MITSHGLSLATLDERAETVNPWLVTARGGICAPAVYDERVTGADPDAGDAQRAAFDAEAERIRSLAPVTAFEESGDLIRKQSDLRGLAARLRAEQAQRVIDSGEASVAELADHMGVTPQRVYQLLKRARESAG